MFYNISLVCSVFCFLHIDLAVDVFEVGGVQQLRSVSKCPIRVFSELLHLLVGPLCYIYRKTHTPSAHQVSAGHHPRCCCFKPYSNNYDNYSLYLIT